MVGEPTGGWIIYTGGVTLIDGSALRMPGSKIFAADGTPMEMHPRPVDVPVTRPVGEAMTRYLMDTLSNSNGFVSTLPYVWGTSRGRNWTKPASRVPLVFSGPIVISN